MEKEDLSIECDNCGAPIKINPSEEYVTCQYCGATYPVSDLESEEMKKERLRRETEKEREIQRETGCMNKKQKPLEKVLFLRFCWLLPLFP